MCITKINFSECEITQETLEMQPKRAERGQHIRRCTILRIQILVSYIRTCHDPIGHIRHTSNTQPLQPMATFYLWNERLIFTSEEIPAAKEVFASTAELCSVNSSLSPLLWNCKIAVTFCVSCPCYIVIRFFDTDLSELIRLSVVEF